MNRTLRSVAMPLLLIAIWYAWTTAHPTVRTPTPLKVVNAAKCNF